jgi:hypothetical protein
MEHPVPVFHSTSIPIDGTSNKELNFLDHLRAVRIAPVERSLREDLRLLAIILLIALIAGLAMGAIVGGAKWLFT